MFLSSYQGSSVSITTLPSKASILLTANVAFLGIPMNNNGNNPHIRSATQIASYVSVVTSSSSMMLALLLRRQHRTRERGSAREVVCLPFKNENYTIEVYPPMYSMIFWQRVIIQDWVLKYWPLSIVYLMLYLCGGKFCNLNPFCEQQGTHERMRSMVTFFLAFFIMCFEKSTTATRFVVAPVSFFCVVLIAWCIRVSWEPSETLEWWKAQLRWQTTGNEETGRFWERFRIRRRAPPTSNAGV